MQQLPLQAGFYRGDNVFTSVDGNQIEHKDELATYSKTLIGQRTI